MRGRIDPKEKERFAMLAVLQAPAGTRIAFSMNDGRKFEAEIVRPRGDYGTSLIILRDGDVRQRLAVGDVLDVRVVRAAPVN